MGWSREKNVNNILTPESALWPGGLETLQGCPACGDSRCANELDDLTDLAFGTSPGTWSLKRCLGCRVLYLNPRPDEQSLVLAYQNYYTQASKRPRSRGWIRHPLRSLIASGGDGPIFQRTVRRYRRKYRGLVWAPGIRRRVLDVGCGSGRFLTVAQALGWQGYGVEFDPDAASNARVAGCEILGHEVSDLDARYEQHFDAVTLSHVIEHVRDPTQTLRHCWRLLKPGGRIWIETPNVDSVGYEIYGPCWRGLEPPRHLVLFNPAALRSCLERAGFGRVAISFSDEDSTKYLFKISAQMQLGRMNEQRGGPLPAHLRVDLQRALQQARDIVRRTPARGELVTAVAYRET